MRKFMTKTKYRFENIAISSRCITIPLSWVFLGLNPNAYLMPKNKK